MPRSRSNHSELLWKIKVVKRLVNKSLKNTYGEVYCIVTLTITALDMTTSKL